MEDIPREFRLWPCPGESCDARNASGHNRYYCPNATRIEDKSPTRIRRNRNATVSEPQRDHETDASYSDSPGHAGLPELSRAEV